MLKSHLLVEKPIDDLLNSLNVLVCWRRRLVYQANELSYVQNDFIEEAVGNTFSGRSVEKGHFVSVIRFQCVGQNVS